MPHVRPAFRRPCRALFARAGLVTAAVVVGLFAGSGCSGCDGSEHSNDPAEPGARVTGPGEPSASTPAAIDPACEPSGAAMLGDTIWIADDETRLLTGYVQRGATLVPMDQFELPTGARPHDVEALAADGNILYAVGSHALVRGEFDDDRARIQVLRLERAAGPLRDDDEHDARDAATPVRLGSIVSPDLRDLAACRESIDGPQREPLCAAIHEQGLEIEGAVWLSGGLFVGLRAPLLPAAAGLDPRAVVLRVATRPEAAPESVPRDANASWQRPLRATIAATLDLGGRGIRSLSRRGHATLIVAGPSGDGRAPHALYEVGSDPARWETAPTRLSVDAPAGTEAVATTPARATWAFVDGGRCSASGARRLTL